METYLKIFKDRPEIFRIALILLAKKAGAVFSDWKRMKILSTPEQMIALELWNGEKEGGIHAEIAKAVRELNIYHLRKMAVQAWNDDSEKNCPLCNWGCRMQIRTNGEIVCAHCGFRFVL